MTKRALIALISVMALMSLVVPGAFADPPQPGDPGDPRDNKPSATTSVQSGPTGVTIRIAVHQSSPGTPGGAAPISTGGSSTSGGGWNCRADIMNIGHATLTWFEQEKPNHPNAAPWVVNCTNGYTNIVWLPATSSSSNVTVVVDTAGTPVDPASLAAEILENVLVPDIEIGVNPAPGLVAVPSWFWLVGYDGAPILESESLGGVTVEVEIRPTAYHWSFGDGAELQSASSGRAYPAVSDIRHTYEISSLSAGGEFTVEVNLTFAVRYRVSGGPWQGLEPITREFASAYPVRQLQSILTSE